MEDKKPTYEQLEVAVQKLQQRCIQAEMNLASINMATTRLEYLFKVIDRQSNFNPEFVQKCIDEVTELLDIKTTAEETEEVN